jgi:hypothetical protein
VVSKFRLHQAVILDQDEFRVLANWFHVSRANCAAKMASFAFLAPEVLGNKLILGVLDVLK